MKTKTYKQKADFDHVQNEFPTSGITDPLGLGTPTAYHLDYLALSMPSFKSQHISHFPSTLGSPLA